jgi:hypothetical protein
VFLQGSWADPKTIYLQREHHRMDDKRWQVNGKYRCLLDQGGRRVIKAIKHVPDRIRLDSTSYHGSCRASDENSDRQPSNEVTPGK